MSHSAAMANRNMEDRINTLNTGSEKFIAVFYLSI